MTDFRKARAGEKLAIRADTYNAMLEAARAHRDASTSTKAPKTVGKVSDGGILLVKNATGSDQKRFAVMGLGEPVISPKIHEERFKNNPVMEAVLPGEEHEGRFVVLQEPLPRGAIGRAMALGVTPAYFAPGESGHVMAGSLEGSTDLVAGKVGAQILWEDERIESRHLGLVRMPFFTSELTGDIYYAVVTSPGAQDKAEQYVVEVYGKTFESLKSPPKEVSAIAIQDPARHYYYWGELVGVRRVGNSYTIIKLHELPELYRIEPEQVCIRLNGSDILMDLYHCKHLLKDSLETFGFSINGYLGKASISRKYSLLLTDFCPVPYRSHYPLAEFIDLETVNHIIANLAAPTRVFSEQDAFNNLVQEESPLTVAAYSQDKYYYEEDIPEAYFFWDSNREKALSIRRLFGRVTINSSTAKDYAKKWPNFPTLPSIYRAQTRGSVPLWNAEAKIAHDMVFPTKHNPANVTKPIHEDPRITGIRPIRVTDTDIKGVYDTSHWKSVLTTITVE